MTFSQKFVTYLIEIPGAKSPGTRDEPIETENIAALLVPRDCFAYYISERSLETYSKAPPLSKEMEEYAYGLTYIGRKYTLQQLLNDTSDSKHAMYAEEMKRTGRTAIVHCSHVDTWHRLNKGDMVISPEKITFAR